MTELQNIALIYESTVLVVEDARARKKYLWDKYYEIWPHAVTIAHLGGDGDAGNYHLSKEKWQRHFEVVCQTIVNRLDPTHGKYSEWFVVLMLKALKQKDLDLFADLFKYARGSEDTYKVKEALATYDKFKHKLDVGQRDINRLTLQQVFDVIEPFLADERELSQKELAKKIKTNETIKLVNNLDGWHVVIPTTKDSAKYYGANTRWCTAAKEDEDNQFDDYNNKGPLYIFIDSNSINKYQWHVNLEDYEFAKSIDGTTDDEGTVVDASDLLAEDIMFANRDDDHASVQDIPKNVWKATINASYDGSDYITHSLKVMDAFVRDQVDLD